ncbi:MAG: tetratricopeptide repeat protein [Planctomycetota bacterium]
MIGKWIASVRIWQATRRYAAGDLDGARARVVSALEADPDLPLSSQYLGVIALKQGQLKKAEEHLLRAKGRGGDPFVVAQGLGGLALLNKRYDEAEKRFGEAIEAFPVAFELGYHVGLARLLGGKEEDGRAEFVRLLCREDEPLFRRLAQLGGGGRD